MFQLVDSMLGYVAMDRRLLGMDRKQSLNFTVQGPLANFIQTQMHLKHSIDKIVEK